MESNLPGRPSPQNPAAQQTGSEQTGPGLSGHPLQIVQIAAELAPLAKVGGLADVVSGLSHELESMGHDVEIILPRYDCLQSEHIHGFNPVYQQLAVPWYQGVIFCTVWFGFVEGLRCYFIDAHSEDNFFSRGAIYGQQDDVSRFAFFSRAAMEFLYKSGRQPHVIHCHDWQTGLVPVLLYEIYQALGMYRCRICYTVHNFRHQGQSGEFLLTATGLGRVSYFCQQERLLDNQQAHTINLMKGGIVYANFVTTVSPRHAQEARDQDQGFGMQPTLQLYQQKFAGILNGLDYRFWNPATDPMVPAKFGFDSLENKGHNRQALRQHMLLAENDKPVVAFIGRLDPQKGLELVRHALFWCLDNNAQFVLLGSSPDDAINAYFQQLRLQVNDHPDCHLELGFSEPLAHLIYAGADIMLVPSLYEPCGLTQLIAMRYGTVPVVRAVGGLADTVFDKHYAENPVSERNGFVFEHYDQTGLESALSRAVCCYRNQPGRFRTLMRQAMQSDYSWSRPAQNYLNIYNRIRIPD